MTTIKTDFKGTKKVSLKDFEDNTYFVYKTAPNDPYLKIRPISGLNDLQKTGKTYVLRVSTGIFYIEDNNNSEIRAINNPEVTIKET